jgi:hypothetical protein
MFVFCFGECEDAGLTKEAVLYVLVVGVQYFFEERRIVCVTTFQKFTDGVLYSFNCLFLRIHSLIV